MTTKSDHAAMAGSGESAAVFDDSSSQPTPFASGAESTTLQGGSSAASTTASAPTSLPANELASVSSAATEAASPSEIELTAPPIQAAEVSDVSAAAATSASASSSNITTASMLPRAASVSSASATSSGTATPTPRAFPSRGFIPASVSNRSVSGSTARSTDAAQRPFPRPGAHAAPTRERSGPSAGYRSGSAASAIASPAASSTVIPSIFGFYSHDANPTTQVSTANASTYQPPVNSWRESPHHRANAARTTQSVLHSPIASPRTGALSFYAPAAQRQHARSTLSLHASRSEQRRQAATGTESSPASFALPSEQPTYEETTTICFTWTIRDLHLLREEVELSPLPSEGGRSVSAGAGKSDVWTSQPIFGDNKWKLELVRTTRPLADHALDRSADIGSSTDQDEDMAASSSGVDPNGVQGSDPAAVTARSSITILSVYLTALVLDYTNADVEIPASIMVGLRPIRGTVGRGGSESGGYLWRRFYDYTFQKEADLFTCHDLPSVSEMLQDSSVSRDDAIALSIQLGLGPGHMRGRSTQLDDAPFARAPVQTEGHHLVPRAVLNSLHGLLDDANTGDVRIVVRERGVLLPDTSHIDFGSDDGHHHETAVGDHGRVIPFPIGSSLPFASGQEADAGAPGSTEDDPDRIFVRDRVLWAHTSVLKSRSDYFRTMLTSDFSEGISRSYGGAELEEGHGRNVRTLQISDADFVTAYWFLRYLYTDDIDFADQDDVRSAVLDEEWAKGPDHGYLTASSGNEDSDQNGGLRPSMLINWTAISQLKDFDELATHEMSYSLPNAATTSSRHDLSGPFVLQGSSNAATTSGSLRQRTNAAIIGNAAASSGSGMGSAHPVSAPTSPSATAGTGASNKQPMADEASRRAVSNASATRTSGLLDPHEHPCADPGPASALSIYKLAHRYHMQDLSRLAALHMVSILTPQSAFPMLLATSMYEELHTQIKTYVYQHWHLVSHTQEFERCCDEVSVGMWGANAGKTMRAFVRSLVSPMRAA